MTPKEVADKLGVSAKTFRSFLRRDPKYKSPGSGGAYDLSGFKFSDIEREFNAWRNAITPRTKRSDVDVEKLVEPLTSKDQSLPVSILSCSGVRGRDRERVRKLTQQRVDRLEAALLSRGLHVAQMNERQGWRHN